MNRSIERLAKIGLLAPRHYVCRAALTAREPFSASQLIQYLRQSGARIGYSSAYRTLAQLVEKGELNRVTLITGEAVHFASDGRERTLWICSACGRIRTLSDGGAIPSLQASIEKGGPSNGSAFVQIRSECPDREACRERKGSNADRRSLEHIWPKRLDAMIDGVI